MNVATQNVRAFSIGPLPEARVAQVAIDGQEMGTLPISGWTPFRKEATGWQAGAAAGPHKRHGVSGPIGDLFFERTILVPGTAGGADATFFNNWVAGHARGLFMGTNGGVHRGGIGGRNSAELALIPDSELSQDDRQSSNLILYGTPASNSVFKALAGRLPISFDATTIRLPHGSFTAPRAAVFAVFPHPDHNGRYVAIHGGVTPDALTWGSHLNMMLLPDYIVYDAGRMLDWGFWAQWA